MTDPPLRLTRRRALQAAAVVAVAKLPEAETAEPVETTVIPDPSNIRPTLPFTPSQASALCRPTCEGHNP